MVYILFCLRSINFYYITVKLGNSTFIIAFNMAHFVFLTPPFISIWGPFSISRVSAVKLICHYGVYLILSAFYLLLLYFAEVRVLDLHHCLEYGQFCISTLLPHLSPFAVHFWYFWCLEVKVIMAYILFYLCSIYLYFI